MAREAITLAHVSDVHFGDDLFGSQPSHVPHQWPHDPTLALRLRGALDRVLGDPDRAAKAQRARDRHALVVINSGDLTQFGTAGQITVGDSYFLTRIKRPPDPDGLVHDESMGLGLAKYALVPGNHDHWKGRPWYIYPPRAYNANLPSCLSNYPRTYEAFPSSPQDPVFAVEVFLIDSNEGLRHRPFSLSAGGALSSTALNKLESELIAAEQSRKWNVPTLRVLVHHHTLDPSKPYKASTPVSTQELVKRCRKHKVRVVLTGHMHAWTKAPHLPPDLIELRCSTTLLPGVSWRRAMTDRYFGSSGDSQGIASDERQGFYIHTITQAKPGSTTLTWKATAHMWDGASGFRPATADDQTFEDRRTDSSPRVLCRSFDISTV